jgi:hypothetical protein
VTTDTSATAGARDAFRDRLEAKGHATDNVRQAATDLAAAIDRGDVQRTPGLEQMLGDLHVALEQDDDQKLGGKSAEAARFIGKAILRELDRQAAAA